MRKLGKKVLALALTGAMILSSAFVSFAGQLTPADKFQTIQELGVIKGEGTAIDGKQIMTRYRAFTMQLRLLGKEQEMNKYQWKGQPSFKDAHTARGDFELQLMAYLFNHKEFNIIGDDKGLRPYDNINAKEYAKIMLNALGYEYEKDFDWKNIGQKAQEVGIVENADQVTEEKTLTIEEVAVWTYNTLAQVQKDSKTQITLGEELGFPVKHTPIELKLEKIQANNLKVVYVLFNQKVDAKTVVDANFVIKQNSTKVPVTAKLLEDGKTVALTASSAFVNQKEYQLTIDKVKSEDGMSIEKTTTKFSPLDASLPKSEKIEVTGPRSFEIYFSEPINEAGKVEIKYGKNSTLGAQVTTNGTNQVSVKLYRDLEIDKDYAVTIRDFKDFAGYNNVITTLEFSYEKDTTAPVATIEKVEQEYVVLSFNKPVKGLTADHFYHTFTAWRPLGIYKDSEMKQAIRPDDNVSTVYLKFYEEKNENSRPIPEGSSILGIRTKANGYEIKDNWGNKLEDVEIKLTVSADRAKPEVSEIKVVSETTLGITFNKPVSFGKDNIEVLNESGNKIDGLRISSITGSKNKYEVVLNKNLSGKTITVNIKNVEDTTLMNNKLDLHTEAITITDKTAPEISKVYKDIRKVDNEYVSKVLYVQFNEGVDENTALDKNNYYLVINGVYHRINNDIEFSESNTRVRITLSDAQADLVVANAKKAQLFVTNIKDTAENTMKPGLVGNFLDLNQSNDVRPNVSVTAVKKDTLQVEFDERLTSVDRNVFQINGTTPVAMSIQEKENKTIVELIYKDEFSTNAEGINFKIVTTKDAKITNSFGNVVNFDHAYDVNDKITPEILSATATGNTVTITFSEKMDKNSFSILSFMVRERKVTAYNVENDTLTLTIDGDALVKDDRIEVEQQYKVLDGNRNELMLKDVVEIKVQ